MAVEIKPLRVILLFVLVGMAAFSIPLQPEVAKGMASQSTSLPTLRFLTQMDLIDTTSLPR